MVTPNKRTFETLGMNTLSAVLSCISFVLGAVSLGIQLYDRRRP
jgi:hypothetical protein